MNAHSFVAPMAHVFNSSEWLARFEAVGGGYTLTPDNEIHLGFFVLNRSDEDQRAARQMIDDLSQTHRQALRKHLATKEATISSGASPHSDESIVEAWKQVCAIERRMGEAYGKGSAVPEAAEREMTPAMDAAEAIIESTPASTTRGVEAKIWLALTHLAAAGEETASVFRSDLAALDHDGTDWHVRLLVSAIKSLRGIEQTQAVEQTAWLAAMEAMWTADRAFDEYKDAVWEPLSKAYEAWLTENGASRKLGDGGPVQWERRKVLEDVHPLKGEWEAVNEEIDRLTDVFSDAQTALMEMPAPNKAALRWKLDKLLDDGDDISTASWSMDYARQTIADYRRILSGEA